MADFLKEFEHLQIPLEDIKSATNNFDETNVIGSGGFGKVYKGELLHSEGFSVVALKRLYMKYGQGDPEFIKEILILSRYKHENIISIFGFCNESGEMILVYDYVSNGSLDRYLSSTKLSWNQRLRICIGAAHGLRYLHDPQGTQQRVLHSDFKSANILLDQNWNAKITDFGLSKIVRAHLTNSLLIANEVGPHGHGYFDPLFMTKYTLTKESEVYSFGVVLFEVLCGRLVADHNEGQLTPLFRKCYEEKKLDTIIPDGIKKQISPGCLETFSDLAYSCLQDNREDRPTMSRVVEKLEIALQIEIAKLYGEFTHLQIRLPEIETATNDFADENIIKEGIFGKDYRGRMLRSGQLTDIVARRLDGIYRQDVEFFGAISMHSIFEHKNIISVVGCCNEDGEKIIIYEHAAHGSLDQYLTDATLTWFRRLQICLGAARALSHIHYEVIHCDINSSKIFLDEDWEAKLFGFELSTRYPESWRHRLLFSHHSDTSEYIDPVYLKNAIVTPKYDVYSFGVILFEVLCCRKAKFGSGDQSIAEIAKRHHEQGKMDEIIGEGLRKQMDLKSLTIFSNTAYRCLKERVQRPTMDQVVKDLEEALEHQWKFENIEHSAAAADEGTASNLLKTENLERLRIQFSDIKSATESFSEKFRIGSGGYGMVYKADLEHLDIQLISSEMDSKNKDNLPKRRCTVAIKRILNRQDEQGKQGFLAEIELLTSCKHHNIVSLLGFSDKDGEMILVYEFLVNGSLDEYLGSTEKKINLTWNQRIRICLDIAEGLKYLHTSMEGKARIIHRDIKSANVLLDENWNAKIADFGLSKFHPANQLASTIQTKMVAGTDVYLDPEYLTTGRYKKESDIYSFGVVLFEILSGTLAYKSVYLEENNKGLAPIARRRFNEGTLKELIDPIMMEEEDEQKFTLNRGPNQNSFDAFTKIAHQCLAETQARRPPIEVVIKELHNALNLQGETTVLSRVRLTDIVQATETFKETYCIGSDTSCMVYKAELDQFESKSPSSIDGKNKGEQPRKRIIVAIKCISSREDGQGEQKFLEEIERSTSYKHPNIVSLLGFCDEDREMILLYEHASNGTLDEYLGNANKTMLTWVERLHMCLQIARGLNHLHTKMIIHGAIKSANIFLGKNLEAKIAYFGLSKLLRANQEASTNVYWDPEYEITGILTIKSDIYSFGVVLFEILCGSLAYDPIYNGREKGLVTMARQCSNDGTINKMIDSKLLQESDKDVSTSNKGPNQDSLDTFQKIAYLCLGETPVRPTMETVITELDKALNFQENLMKDLQISLDNITLATQEFSQENCVGSARDWKVYKGELSHANGRTTIVAKRWIRKYTQENTQFRTELDILFNLKHENIIGLAGYCNNRDETIIVYKHAWNGSLDEHLDNASLTWMKRIQICIDVASGLEFVHGGAVTLKKLVHGNIKSANILLTADWKAKISNFEFSSIDSLHQHTDHVRDNSYGTFGYLDPEYAKSGCLTDKSDIYSLGVILLEILCGRVAWGKKCEDHSQSLGPLGKRRHREGKLKEMVFNLIKKQIVPRSFETFANITYQCLS